VIEYTYYMITRPTRAGRRPVSVKVHLTRADAKADYVGYWKAREAGERAWRRARDRNGWRIEPVTVCLDDGVDA